MSVNDTASAFVRMLDSDDYAAHVARDAGALRGFDLDETERAILQAAAAEGLDRIYRSSGDGSPEMTKYAKCWPESMADEGRGVFNLCAYLSGRSFDTKTQTSLHEAIFRRYGTRVSASPMMQIVL